MKFGENLKQIRKQNKISQEELAERLGVSRQSVSKWETGENYPSMQNIMCLCTIFKCKINELVHEDFVDINFLDEEIKMSVVKFKKNEQKKMKIMSKGGSILSKIFKIICIIAIIISVIGTIFSVTALANSKYNKESKVITVFGKNCEFMEKDNGVELISKKDSLFVEGLDIKRFESALNMSKGKQYITVIMLGTSFISVFIFLYLVFKNIEKLLVSVHDKDTPFSLENVRYIRKIAFLLIFVSLIPDLFGSIAEVVTKIDFGVEIEIMSYLYIVLLLAISYIFKYGYEIQLDSKGKMYGDENE